MMIGCLIFQKINLRFLGLVVADVHAGTTTNISKDAECLVDESSSLGLVTAKMHTETTAHDDWVLDFSEDKSSFLGLVVANVHAGTTTNISKDAKCLVDESSFLGLVTAKMHTETTAHLDGRVVESPACVFFDRFSQCQCRCAYSDHCRKRMRLLHLQLINV